MNPARWLTLALTVALVGACGSDEEEASEEETEQSVAPEDGPAGPYSCEQGQTCHDYASLPFAGAGSDPVSIASAREACGDGTWAEGGCDFSGVTASCSLPHTSALYRDGADLDAAERACRELSGIWDGP